MMKKCRMLLAALLCLCLLSGSALAASGDAVLARRDYENNEGFQDYISSTIVRGDELVLIGETALYTWKVGQADLTDFTWDENRYAAVFAEDEEEADEFGSYTSQICAFCEGNDIYVVLGREEYDEDGSSFAGAFLAKVFFDGETATLEAVEDGELDWEELIEYYEDESYVRYAEQSCCIDGTLYVLSYGSSDMEVCAVPLDGGYSTVLEDIEGPRGMTSYKDGQVLFMLYDYSDNNVGPRFIAYDPETEETTEICSLPSQNYSYPSGIAYSAETDRLYYMMAGSVVELNLETGETQEVNDVPVDYGNNNAVVLPGGYYVVSSYEAVIVRNVDPAQKAQIRLKVYDSTYNNTINQAYYAFGNVRGDVSVSVSTEYLQPSQLIESMMNQSADYDIFVLTSSDEAFNSIYSRGYMTDLSQSEAVAELFTQLYPQIAESLSYEGAPVAVPIAAYGNALGVVNDALEKSGLTMADIPTNWYDLLDNLDELQARLEDTGVTLFYNWYTQNDLKMQLFSCILQDYLLYMNAVDPEMGFNTDVLRSVLAKLDEVDFAALGLPEGYEDEDGATVSYYIESESILFETYVGCTIGDYYSGYTPLLLSLTPDTDAYLRLEVTAAFVNPYSENKDAAIEFLECALQNMGTGEWATLCDVEVEPVRSSYYQEALESAQDDLENWKQALEEAEEGDKQEIEGYIADNEEWLQRIDEFYWNISPTAIEWYRSNDDHLAVSSYNVLYGNESSSEVSAYINQYYEGEISATQMLEAMDKKLQMIILEGN